MNKILIIDGYTDEPAGLGVPPYINVYPRLIAGAVWSVKKDVRISYWTVDQYRRNPGELFKQAFESDLIVIIAGMEVPGHYVGGKPMSFKELEYLAMRLSNKDLILTGPAARFGFGAGGGTSAYSTRLLKKYFKEIVRGDVELYFKGLVTEGFEKTDPYRLREDYSTADEAFVKGARIVQQHPNYGRNLIVEIETFRGCPRWVTGGCSFCIEPRYGKPITRKPESIVREVGELYSLGVRHVRIGRQPDILVYGSSRIGDEEFPKPCPEILEKVFKGIRNVAPGLRTIHIDNVNPGTIAKHPKESLDALKVIIKYHTPGDVAALGIESFDERVVRANNLKATPDEAMEALRLINRVGRIRGWNGLPHLLPGINLLYGLPGETRETFRVNEEHLGKIIHEGLLIRRVNIRKVSILENTPLWLRRRQVYGNLAKHEWLYKNHRIRVMRLFDKEMLRKVVPEGVLLPYLYVERSGRNMSLARFPGSYPIAVKFYSSLPKYSIVSGIVKKHSSKSVLAELV
uniref:Radical SAM protein n=1 Tax=Thermosphaera aggregans TaxID=54254 RepID=A0A7C2BK82_9CREN